MGVSVWQYWAKKDVEKPYAPASALYLAINTCDGIAEKSVAHLSAQVEFQLLEIAGRKARVMQICMNDQGFIENPAWVKYAEQVAQKNANAQQVSINEAFENLRRKSMFLSDTSENTPIYWLGKVAK